MLRKGCDINVRGWPGLVIVVAMCSLLLSLATRFSVAPPFRGYTVKSVDNRSGEPKRQHLDRDAAELADPIADCVRFKPTELYPHAIFSEPSRVSDVFTPSLFTRPPPLSFSLFS